MRRNRVPPPPAFALKPPPAKSGGALRCRHHPVVDPVGAEIRLEPGIPAQVIGLALDVRGGASGRQGGLNRADGVGRPRGPGGPRSYTGLVGAGGGPALTGPPTYGAWKFCPVGYFVGGGFYIPAPTAKSGIPRLEGINPSPTPGKVIIFTFRILFRIKLPMLGAGTTKHENKAQDSRGRGVEDSS
jgi:hypothetical protein